jgi:hypothetical protein
LRIIAIFITILMLGLIQSDSSNAIVGGVSKKQDFFVEVYVKDQRCGGVIYQKNIIITSAHCLYPFNSIVTIVHKNRVYYSKNIIISKSYIHTPNLVSKDDIAFILLSKNIKNGGNIQIANLEQIDNIWKNADYVYTYGIGRICMDCYFVYMPRYIVSSIKTIDFENGFIYYPARIDHGVCPGDSGGATVYEKDNKTYLISITSGSNSCFDLNNDFDRFYIGILVYPYLDLLR